MSKDNNKAASVPDLDRALDAAYPIPDSPHTSVVQRAVDNRIAFRHGYEAASSSQSSTPVPRVGGPDEAVPASVERSSKYIMDAVKWYADHKDASTLSRIESMVTELESIAHVARQRQESAPERAPYAYEECDGNESSLVYADWFSRGLGKMNPNHKYTPLYTEPVITTPSAAVAEGVDTAHLRELAEQYRHVKNRYHKGAAEEKEVDVSLADLAAFCAQQREAGRRELAKELARALCDLGHAKIEIEALQSALARQPASEGLTEEGITKIGQEVGILASPLVVKFARAIERRLSAAPPAKAKGMSDTKRLDFIEANTDLQLKLHKRRWSFVGFTNYEFEVHKTAREAIDAAILAQQAKKGNQQ